MIEWVISPEDGAAYLDLRGNLLSFGDAERMLETLRPYFASRQLTRIIFDVRDLDPLPGPVEVLVAGIEGQAQTHPLRVEVLRPGRVS